MTQRRNKNWFMVCYLQSKRSHCKWLYMERYAFLYSHWFGIIVPSTCVLPYFSFHLKSRNVPNSSSHLKTLKTDSFVLHHFQSSSGIMFVVNSDLDSPDLQSHLQNIYSQVFVECVTRNPLYRYLPDESINCPLFDEKLREYVMTSMK